MFKDFSTSGLGIGRLSKHDGRPVIPTVEAIERMERIDREMDTCCRCGQSDLLDGVMFTNGGGDVCDDCF